MQDSVSEAPGSGANSPWQMPEREKTGKLGSRKWSSQADAEQEMPKVQIEQQADLAKADLAQKKLSFSKHLKATGDKISEVSKDVLTEEPEKATKKSRVPIPLPDRLQECRFRIPSTGQMPLRLCLQGPAKAKWDKEMRMLAANDPQAAFVKDAPRSRYLIQENYYEINPGNKAKIETQIDTLLQGAKGLKRVDGQDRLSPEQCVELRHQFENLLQQEAFTLDEEQLSKFLMTYINPESVTICSDLAALSDRSRSDDENEFVRQTPYQLSFSEDGKTAIISAVRAYRIVNAAEEHFGYDALSFEVHIDLTAIYPPDYILGRDCAQVITNTVGFQHTLSDLKVALARPDMAPFSHLWQAKASARPEPFRITTEPLSEKFAEPISLQMPLNVFAEPLAGSTTGLIDRVLKIATVKVNENRYDSRMKSKATLVKERLDAELREVLFAKGMTTRFSRPRTQLENLFRLDRELTSELQKRYEGKVVPLIDIATDELTSVEAHQLEQSFVHCTREGDKLGLSGISYVRVHDKEGAFLGYDAIKFTVQIDLAKVKEPDYLFADGAATIQLETLGLQHSLERFGYSHVGPRHSDTSLDACFETKIGLAQRPMRAAWQEEIKDKLQDHPKDFVRDARRDPIRLNGYLQLRDETLIGEGLTHLLRKQKPQFSEQELKGLRFEVENMIQQRLFGLDLDFTAQWNRRYTLPIQVESLPFADTLEQAGKQQGYEVTIADNKIVIVGRRYYQLKEIKDPESEIVGFEAFRASLTIDLSKVDAQNLLSSKGCGQVTTETSGYYKNLEDIPF